MLFLLRTGFGIFGRVQPVDLFNCCFAQYARGMFSSQFNEEIDSCLNALIDAPGNHQRIAVFDADGTLWDGDASEALLQWAEARGHITGPNGARDVLTHYLKLVDADRINGFGWAAQVFQGCAVESVSEWAEQCFQEQILPRIFDEMAQLIARFRAQAWQVWIVSASPRFAVLPGCKRLGVDPRRLLSVELEIQDGRYTDQLAGPVTSGFAKVTRLQQVMAHRPAFVAGNSIDDVPLLEHASAAAMVVNPSDLHSPGHDLTLTAQRNEWMIHRTTV